MYTMNITIDLQVECKPMWFANQWSKCSSKCKGTIGVKTRTVMCGVMKIVPPATSDNSTSSNATEEAVEEEGSGDVAPNNKRKKRQAEDSENVEVSSGNSTGEKSIVIVEDSECDEAFK